MKESRSRVNLLARHILILGMALTVGVPALSAVTIYEDRVAFESENAIVDVPLPDWNTLACFGTDCSCTGDTSAMGCDEQLVVEVAPHNTITITAPNATSCGGLNKAICVNEPIPWDKFQPDPISNTLTAQGEDDFLVSFQVPVQSVGFSLLTNSLARERIELRDEFGGVIDNISIDDLTLPNSFEFIGLRSTVPIASVLIDTDIQAPYTEGEADGLPTEPFPLNNLRLVGSPGVRMSVHGRSHQARLRYQATDGQGRSSPGTIPAR